MSEFYNIGDQLEGLKGDVFARKIEIKNLRKHPLYGDSGICFETDRNSSIEITRELDLNENERRDKERRNIHLNLGDKLRGDAITIYIRSRRPPRITSDEGASHTHGGQFFTADKQPYAIIKYSFEHINKVIEKSIPKILK